MKRLPSGDDLVAQNLLEFANTEGQALNSPAFLGARLFDRRRFLTASAFLGAGFLGTGIADALVVEPLLLTRVTRYRLSPQGWPANLRLTFTLIADLHACDPWMSVERIEQIVHDANLLGADATLLLGDYVAGHGKITATVPNDAWARALSGLRAPLGVFAILGNHDWWDDETAQLRGRGPISARRALERAGIPVLENNSVRLAQAGQTFWLAGLGDQEAFRSRDASGRFRRRGVDDLAATLRSVDDASPVVLMAHEPDIFPQVPERVSVTFAGHTHGGQVRLFGMSPVAPSPLSRIYNYGHYQQDNRHLVVSGGLGCSFLPIRLGMPPEIVHVTIEA